MAKPTINKRGCAALMLAFFVMNTYLLLAQNAPTGCPSIRASGTVSGLDTTIQCGGCIILHADVTATATTANDYTVSQITYNPPFSFQAGTQINLNRDDYYAAIINLPFSFCFYGQTYTQACVGANGVVSFNANNNGGPCAYSYYSYLPIPNANFPSSLLNAIYGVCEDIYPGYSGNGQIYQGVLGSYPCRTACISYYSVPLYGNYSVRNTYQIVLYEGTNIIDVYIQQRNCCSSTNSGHGLVGVQNANGTMAVAAPNRNGGTWTAYAEAWRFTPTGTPRYTVTWYDGTDTTNANGVILGHDTINSDTAMSRILVCPRGNNPFTARLRYTACNGDHFDIISTTTITSSDVTYTDTSFCHTGTYNFHGRILSSSGMYYDTIRNSAGCDSIIERLNLRLTSTSIDNVTACNTYTWQDGNTYTRDTNTPTVLLTNQFGCDSTVTLHLTITPTTFDTIYDTICEGSSFNFAGNTVTDSGTYTVVLPNRIGCDSSVTLIMSIEHPKNDTIHDTICEGTYYSFSGNNIYNPGVYYDTSPTARGCDSLTVLFLAKKYVPKPQFAQQGYTEEICLATTISRTDINPESQGNRYTWHWNDGYVNNNFSGETVTHTYSSPGTYDIICAILAANGCRDTILLRAKVYEYSRAAFSWNPPIITILSPEVQFRNLSHPHDPQHNTYLWEIYNDTSAMSRPTQLTEFEPVYQWQTTGHGDVGNYPIRLIAYTQYATSDGGTLVCSDTAESSIFITNDFLQFPNVITANGDGLNDIFVIKNLIEGKGYTDTELFIFNSWGRVVYHKQNISKYEDFWDPAAANEPQGTYYYRFTGKGYKGNIQRNGTVQVLR